MKAIAYTIGAIIALVILIIIGNVLGLIGDTAQVAREEFGPRPALEKYEWFKNAANQLEAKSKDIDNYTQVLQSMDKEWSHVARQDWPRDVRQDYSQRKSELAGLITAYNSLVAEYSSASSKFNWEKFEEKSDRPPLSFQEYSAQ